MNRSSANRRVLYIVSPRYSGSTLLAFVIGSHPDIATIGERKKFYNKAIIDDGTQLHCSCGTPFKSCPTWTTLSDRLRERFSAAQLAPNFSTFRLSEHRLVDRALYEGILWSVMRVPGLPLNIGRIRTHAEANRYLIELVCEQQSGEVFLDTSKPLRQALFLSRTPGLSVRILLLTRDPRAQVCSALKYNDWTTAQAARNWVRETRAHFRVVPRLGIPYLHLRYEDFSREPELKARQIFELCGVAPERSAENFRDWDHHVMGNGKMRLGTDTQIEERRDWEQRLSREQVRIIERETAAWAHLYTDAGK